MVPLKPKVIHLAPEHHPLPVCPDFEDFNAVLAFEQAMRTHRAHVEAFDVTPLDGRVDGAWQVSNQRGRSYTVDIVDDSGQHDACTCPDFLEGELDLCKHLEAVKRTLRARPALHRAYRALSAHPIRPTLTVHAAGGLSLHRLGAWPPQALAALGLPAHPTPLQSHSPLLQPGPQDLEGVRLTHAARPAAARLQARARLQQRTRSFLQAFEDGKVGVDVLNKPLFPYQRTGVVHLAAHGRALLADDMGLGKTVQAMAACEIMRARGEVDRVLIVAPASIKHQWARELEAYTGRQVVVVGGPPAQRAAALASSAPYKIISYEATWRDLSCLQALDTDLLILDEAQRAKNFRTRTAATLKAIPSRFLFVLTGTPIENRLDDLYALLQLVDPQILGPLWRFNFNHHKQGPTAKVLGCKHLSQLRETLAPILLRRRKEAVLDQLPALTEQTRYTALTVAGGLRGSLPGRGRPLHGPRREAPPDPRRTAETPGRPAQGPPGLQRPGTGRPRGRDARLAQARRIRSLRRRARRRRRQQDPRLLGMGRHAQARRRPPGQARPRLAHADRGGPPGAPAPPCWTASAPTPPARSCFPATPAASA